MNNFQECFNRVKGHYSALQQVLIFLGFIFSGLAAIKPTPESMPEFMVVLMFTPDAWVFYALYIPFCIAMYVRCKDPLLVTFLFLAIPIYSVVGFVGFWLMVEMWATLFNETHNF